MEMMDFSGQGNLGTFTFTKGSVAQTLNPANASGFSNVIIRRIHFIGTAVEELKMFNLYQVYPILTSFSIFVNLLDLQNIEIFKWMERVC